MLILLLIIVLATPLINILTFFFLKKEVAQVQRAPAVWPKVAVLIACRNEEHTIANCIKAIQQLDYPAENIKIYVGNDDSEDNTLEVLKVIQATTPNLHIKDIKENWGLARGKANVLAQLAQEVANWADYYFITDADIRVNPKWIKGLLQQFSVHTGLVSGFTLPNGKGFWPSMQRLDWLLALAWAKGYSLWPGVGSVLTAIGNNMVVSKAAYAATGGYERIPFSVTEDFELKVQVEEKGYKARQVISPWVFAYTLPSKSFVELIRQRHRWMKGALQLPLNMVSLLLLQALYFPALVFLLIKSWPWAAVALLLKWISQYLLSWLVLKRVRIPDKLPLFPLYEVYSGLISIITLVYHLLPIPVQWKNRSYRQSRTSL